MSGGGSLFCPVLPSWKEWRKNIGFGGAGRAGEVRAAGTVGMRAQAVGCPRLCQRLFVPPSAAFRLLQKGTSLKRRKKKGEIYGCAERCGSSYGAAVGPGYGAEGAPAPTSGGCRCVFSRCFFTAGASAGQHLGCRAPACPGRAVPQGHPCMGQRLEIWGLFGVFRHLRVLLGVL